MYQQKSSPIDSRDESERRRPEKNDHHVAAVVSKEALLRPAPVQVLSSAQATGFEGPQIQVVDRSRWQRRYTANLRIADTAVVCGAVMLAQYIRFGQAPLTSGNMTYETAYSALITIIWLFTLAGFEARSERIIGRGIDEYRRAVEASLWTFGAVAIAELLFKLGIARGYLAVALPVGVLGLLLSRFLARGYLARKRVDGKYQTAVLAVGKRDAVASLANELTRNPKDGYQIVGACIPGGTATGEHLIVRDRSIPIVGSDASTVEAIRMCGADTVVIVGTEHFGIEEIRRLIWTLEPMGVDLVVSPGIMDVAVSRLAVMPVAGLPLLHIEKPQYRNAACFQKRVFDFGFALAAFTASLPILLLAAIAIKVTSRGPIFYSSERIGFGGKPFYMIKLRTMVQDADKKLESLLDSNECDGHLFKIRSDPRITPVGHILRRFSLDELPQFINVLRGEMSVVGPRPLFRLGSKEGEYDSDSLRRLLVKPGITGLWQISGRSDLCWDAALRLDLSYVDNWSMATDIVIIAKTVRSVFRQKGAY